MGVEIPRRINKFERYFLLGLSYQNPHIFLYLTEKGKTKSRSMEREILRLECQSNFREEVTTRSPPRMRNSRPSLLQHFFTFLEKNISSPAYRFSGNPPHSANSSLRQKTKLPAAKRKVFDIQFQNFGTSNPKNSLPWV